MRSIRRYTPDVVDLQPQTVEEVLTLEKADASGWTSDSQEAFMAPYVASADDFPGTAPFGDDREEAEVDQELELGQ